MVGQAEADCPRCGTRAVAFHLLGQHCWNDDDLGGRSFDVFSVCGICNRGVILTYECEIGDGAPIDQSVHYRLSRNGLVEIAPAPLSIDAPRHTPEPIANFFRQGMEAVNQGSWDAAGAMFRKTLEAGLKAKFSDVPPSWKPFKRIEHAAEHHGLTPDLAEWSHRIRDLGNDAVHEQEPFTEAQAKEMADFVRIVLEYMFTYPGEMEVARKAATSEETQTSVRRE